MTLRLQPIRRTNPDYTSTDNYNFARFFHRYLNIPAIRSQFVYYMTVTVLSHTLQAELRLDINYGLFGLIR